MNYVQWPTIAVKFLRNFFVGARSVASEINIGVDASIHLVRKATIALWFRICSTAGIICRLRGVKSVEANWNQVRVEQFVRHFVVRQLTDFSQVETSALVYSPQQLVNEDAAKFS